MTPEQIAKLQHYLADKALLQEEIDKIEDVLKCDSTDIAVSFNYKNGQHPILTLYGIPREFVSALKQMRANKVKYLETVQNAIDEL